MKNVIFVLLMLFMCTTHAQTETLKVLIPANVGGGFGGVGIAWGSVDPVVHDICEKQVCKYNVPNGTTVSIWRTGTPLQYEFDYWIKNGEINDSQLLVFQMLENTTVLMKENKIFTGVPVIIVPGIFGSWSTEMFCNDEDAVGDMEFNLKMAKGLGHVKNFIIPTQWTVDPIKGIYNTLHESLTQSGLRPTFFGYDWRDNIQYIAIGNPNNPDSPSLVDIIDQVKVQYGVSQVDIVAHSMGGLVVREYIQNHYRGDIRKFAMIGTPNQGSLDVYRIWEAGHFSNIGGTVDVWIKEIVLENMKEGCENSFMNDAKFVRKWLPSVKQLMPTFDYFSYPTGVTEDEYYLEEVEDMCYYNDYLINLNNDIDTLINQGVDIHIFASDNKRTLQGYESNNQHSLDNCNRKKWADERPVEKFFANPDSGSAGDGRVLFNKSAYPVEDMPSFSTISITNINGKHSSLPGKVKTINGIVNFLKEAGNEPAPY